MKYIDRQGNISLEDTGQDALLRALYTHRLGRSLLKILVRPAVSRLVGQLLNTGLSKLLIPPFVKKHQVDLSCCTKASFTSYNDFFTRQMLPQYRPIADAPGTLISPCDGKLSIYPVNSSSRFTIKQTEYTVESLLRSKKLARHFSGGYAFIFRLTVDDYHHYCYMADAAVSPTCHIPGIFHTVNPIANDTLPIYKENTREFCLLKTKEFGTLLMMEVGALLVGKICNYHKNSITVTKGEEKGRFEFGGSTIVLLVQKNRIKPDKALEGNTLKGFETLVKMGEAIGTVI